MQQLKRSYSLTDLGEQYDRDRFTEVTEEEEGETKHSLFWSYSIHSDSSIPPLVRFSSTPCSLPLRFTYHHLIS